MGWSTEHYAKQYVAFEDHRTRPVRDLLSAIPLAAARTAIDIGCGPGNSTEALAARFPSAKISGIDSSGDMISAARKRLPNLNFEVIGVEHWKSLESYDVILANASLQWVSNHKVLYPALMQKLNKGGVLAVQTPDNFNEPAHKLIRSVAENGAWAGEISSIERAPREPAEWYYDLLRPYSENLDIWRTIYYHPLPGGAPDIVEWFKGSALRPYLEPLSEDARSEFLLQYTREIEKAYPKLSNGTVLLPFPRLFIVATR